MYKKMQECYAENKNSEELKNDCSISYSLALRYHGGRETTNFDKLRRLDKQFWKTLEKCCIGRHEINRFNIQRSVSKGVSDTVYQKYEKTLNTENFMRFEFTEYHIF